MCDHKNNEPIKWHCICSCQDKKEVDVIGKSLRNGKTTSCGCYNKKRTKESLTKDLKGKTFGKLTVLKQVDKPDKKGAFWLCQCSCKKKTLKIVRSHALISGNTSSCGCRSFSKGEEKIANVLRELNIEYIHEYKLKNSQLRFDFFLPNLNTAIEYDGEQHFKNVDY